MTRCKANNSTDQDILLSPRLPSRPPSPLPPSLLSSPLFPIVFLTFPHVTLYYLFLLSNPFSPISFPLSFPLTFPIPSHSPLIVPLSFISFYKTLFFYFHYLYYLFSLSHPPPTSPLIHLYNLPCFIVPFIFSTSPPLSFLFPSLYISL